MDSIVPAVVIGGVTYMLVKQDGPIPPPRPVGPGYSYDPYLNDGGQAGFWENGRPLDPDVQPKVDLLQASMRKAYDGMSAVAKSEAANRLNTELELDPPLRGDETWETVARVAGGAAAAAGCNLIPGVGTAVSPLCAMAGAYLGVKLEDWVSQGLDKLQSWAGDAASDISNRIQGAAEDVGGWIRDLF